MTRFGGWSVPGQGAIETTSEYELFWGGDRGKGLILEQSAVYSGAIRDAGNTPTTIIRGGLIVAKLTSSGELEEWDADATDGTQNLYGVVPLELRAQDFDANNADRVAPVIVRAPLKVAGLLIEGSALDGHANEYAARRTLHAMGCILDDDPQGYKAGAARRTVFKTADYTVTADENGTLFTTRGNGGALTFTLPAVQLGLEFEFYNEADQNMIIAAPADTMVVFNDLTATSFAFQQAAELIGGSAKVVSNDNATKWLLIPSLANEAQTTVIV